MEKCIDLFSRLLVATITFVVPILINLLSTFTAGENRRKELEKDTEEQISKRAAEEVQSNPEKIKETIGKTSQEYKLNSKATKKELDLLNPIIQFWKIFISLLISFGSLSIAYIIRENHWNLYNHMTSISALSLCVVFYGVALFFIIRILYTITKTKKIIEGKNP